MAGLSDQARQAVARFEASLLGGVLARFSRIQGRDRVLALAGQAFTALIPLMIVVAGLAHADDASANRLVVRFRLTGSAADAVRILFTRPPGNASSITLLGFVILFYSSLSCVRSLQRAWEAAWELPPAGMRGTLHAASGFAVLIAEIAALVLVTRAVSGWPAGSALAVTLRTLVAALLWREIQYLLLSRRVPRKALIPGALVAGVGQVVVSVYSALWMPRVIAQNAARYGIIGVTFAILTWLILLAFGVIAAAVVSAEIAHRWPHAARMVARSEPPTIPSG